MEGYGCVRGSRKCRQPWILSRWVLTEKMKGGAMVRKARLCVRGCEEDQSQMKTDSPTCQKESLRLLLCVLASKQWTLHSIDIKSAYLQGMPLTREVYMMPPTGFILLQAYKKLSLFMTILAKNNYGFFMTSAIFLCRGLMFSNDVTH